MAEAIATSTSGGRFIGYSAGSHPGGVVNSFALEMIESLHYPNEKLRSKSWDEFAMPGAPQMDFIITVCDQAAGETCPIWPGRPVTAHWGFPDPAAATGSDQQKRMAFRQVFAGINSRIRIMLDLPVDRLDAASMQAELRNIGKTPPTSQ